MDRSRRHRKFLPLLLLPALTTMAFPAAAKTGEGGSQAQLPQMEGSHSNQMPYADLPPGDTMEERIVRAAYKATERMVNADGKDLEFKVGDFQRYDPPSYPKTRFGDIFTINPPVRLNVVRHETYHKGDDGSATLFSVVYEASWQVRDPSSFIQPQYLDVTVDGVIRMHLEQGTLPGAPDHIVSYAVTASMLGRTQSYRAVAMWFSDDPIRGQVVISDSVTDRVAEALAEPGPVMSRREGDSALASEVLEKIVDAAFDPQVDSESCVYDNKTYVYPLARISGTEGHYSGNHFASATFSFSCLCSPNCVSVCQPSLGSTVCIDTGSTGPYEHVTHSRNGTFQGTEVEGNITAARCSAGWACFVESCPAANCGGGSISLLGGPAEISFSFSGRAIWDGQRDFAGHCGRCDVEQPIVLPRRAREGRGPFNRTIEDPRGGGGGGGDSGCRREVFECHPVFSYNYCGDFPRPCLVEHCDDICQE
jgi:hypothetical protein